MAEPTGGKTAEQGDGELPAPIKSVIVVGGGIGGLTVANAFLRHGISVEVYEKAKQFSTTAGAGIGFSPNGQACLRSLGISAEEIAKVSYPLARHVFFSDTALLTQSDHFVHLQKKYGMSVLGILRADVIGLLAKPLEAKGLLHWNAAVTEVSQPSPDKVRVTLASGEVKEADLVIGADGIKSVVAKSVFGQSEPPIFNGENCFSGVIDGPIEPIASLGTTGIIGDMNSMIQVYDRGQLIAYPAGGPASPKYVWSLIYSSDTPPAAKEEWSKAPVPEGSSTAKGKDDPTIRNELKALLDDKYAPTSPVYELLKRTPDSRLLHFGLWYRKQKPVWHQGRVVMLGDAAHATLPYMGQGATQAIEDGVVLVNELAASGFRDVEGGLTRYHEGRSARTKKIVDMAWYVGKFTNIHNSWLASARNMLLKYVVDRGVFMKIAEKEILENAAIGIKPVAEPAEAEGPK